jgi:hypothetical protein
MARADLASTWEWPLRLHKELSVARSVVKPFRFRPGSPPGGYYFAFAGGALVALCLKAERNSQ